MLRVAWAGERYGTAPSENYGLAWASGNNRVGNSADMPEPPVISFMVVGVVAGGLACAAGVGSAWSAPTSCCVSQRHQTGRCGTMG